METGEFPGVDEQLGGMAFAGRCDSGFNHRDEVVEGNGSDRAEDGAAISQDEVF